MPLFFQHDVDNDTRLAVWKIEEEESFFLQHVPLHRAITHPHKRLQHLAGRYLLQYLFPDFPISLIKIADTRKPFLEDEAYHFSISHCSNFAAVIVSKSKRVGIDIEVITDKVKKIQHKFVNDEDWEQVNQKWEIAIGDIAQDICQLTLLWSCKEAVFKWFGLGEVDFKKHIEIKQVQTNGAKGFSKVLFKKNEDLLLDLHSHFYNDVCMSYVVT